MKNESVKKSLEKSKNVLEEKRKNGQAKNLHNEKTNTFTIIAMNFVHEQLKPIECQYSSSSRKKTGVQ